MRIFAPSAAALLTDHSANGEGLIAWALFSRLAARGHEVVACVRTADVSAEPAFTIVETGRASRFESVEPLAYARRVARIFADHGGPARFDVAHWLFPQGPEAVLDTLPATVPVVIGPQLLTWPSPSRIRHPGDLVLAVIRPLLERSHRQVVTRAAGLLASVPAAVANFPPEVRPRVQVLPFGIDETAFTPAELPTEPTVLFIGHLEARKGVRELVEAFARVREELADCRLVMAGEGPERGWLEARRRQLGEGLVLLGSVPHTRIPELLRDASLLCLPSHGEPFGMAIVEGMAAGRAIVALDDAGPRYLVDHGLGGLLVPDRRVESLSGALLELLTDRERLAAMGRHNRGRGERELAWHRIIDELERVYARAVDGAGRPASARRGGS